MERKLLKTLAVLGVPGVALGVFYLLLRTFDFQFSAIDQTWSAVIVIVFLLVVALVTIYALHRWSPRIETNTRKGASSGLDPSGDATRKTSEAYPSDDADHYVPFPEAALMAYEETRGTKAAAIAEGLNRDNVLGYYAHALFDGSTTLYGKHPPSRIIEPIPNEEKARCGFSDDQSALRRHGEDRNLYEDLQIRHSDLSRRIKELRELSQRTARESQVQKIDDLYAQAVELRNHAASLRVLDAATEAKMNALQSQLVEEIRKLEPLRAINLRTINTYDWRDHPIMNLQDAERTLQFSEVLLRIREIIDDR
jgi:hypothetical protein